MPAAKAAHEGSGRPVPAGAPQRTRKELPEDILPEDVTEEMPEDVSLEDEEAEADSSEKSEDVPEDNDDFLRS